MLTEIPQSTGDDLLNAVAADPWGWVAPSYYDTARLVAAADWLPGHDARVDFLCQQQRVDGGWGGPDGYAFVPTLSATAALLTELERHGRSDRVVRAATGGVAALRRWLHRDTAPTIPDTIGVEVLVPALLTELAEVLQRGRAMPELADETGWLQLPAGFDPQVPAAMRAQLESGTLPAKTWACLEVCGPAAAGATGVRPAGGSVACSAAATAAWLGPPGAREDDHGAREFLETLQQRHGGPVPGVTPITYFEAAWVLNSVALGGLTASVPSGILDRLVAGIGETGVPAADGLPGDGDDTAAVLAALLRHGRPQPVDALLHFADDGYFRCFDGERNPSVSTNAHALETLALYLALRPGERPRLAAPAASTARWLRDRQEADGSWWDKWHASPYYATACCMLALSLYGGHDAAQAVARGRNWLLASQRADGSWGRWFGTVEETAYAVQALVLTTPERDGTAAGAPGAGAATPPEGTLAGAIGGAVRRGCAYLTEVPTGDDHTALWHAKDLYTPVTVVRAAQLAALRLGARAGWRVPQPRDGG